MSKNKSQESFSRLSQIVKRMDLVESKIMRNQLTRDCTMRFHIIQLENTLYAIEYWASWLVENPGSIDEWGPEE